MNRVDVWTAAVSDVGGQAAELRILDQVEVARYHELRDHATAQAYLTVHQLTRRVVGDIIGVPAHLVTFDRTCPRCAGQHGRPTVHDHPALHLSLSRTTALIGLAVTTAGPVGIDVEQVAGAGFAGFDEVALHPNERVEVDLRGERPDRARATTWVRKEAALKALGTGLRTDPATVLTPPRGIPTVVVAGTAPLTVIDLVLPGPAAATHVAAVAVENAHAEVIMHTHPG